LTRRGRDVERTTQAELAVAPNEPKPTHKNRIPFAQRIARTVAEACEATGLGRTKIYELIGNDRVATTPLVAAASSLYSLCYLWLASMRPVPRENNFVAPHIPTRLSC